MPEQQPEIYPGFAIFRFPAGIVEIVIPFAPSNNTSSLPTCYKKHENIKKRAYGQRIRENEHASFTPVVLSQQG